MTETIPTDAADMPAATNLPIGEIITWSFVGSCSYPLTTIRAALAESGLPVKLIRDMIPRNAFARACKSLSAKRVIRQLSDAGGELRFQFTSEERDDTGEYRYNREAILVLDKTTGAVQCNDKPDLATDAQLLIEAETGRRTTHDITTVIQRVFGAEKSADLFPIREQGGCYFVTAAASEVTRQVSVLCERLGVRLSRFAVAGGSGDTMRSVTDAVTSGIDRMIDEHFELIETFDFDTRASTFERHITKVQETRFKLDCYAVFLDDRRQMIEERLADAEKMIRAKAVLNVNATATTMTVENVSEPDAADLSAA